MKEREKEEAPKMAAIVAMTAARSILDANESNNNKVEEIVLASELTFLLQSGFVIPSI